MNRIKQFAGQTFTYGLGHILSRILYFLLITVYLTYRLEDPYQYGIYTDLYAYVSLLIVLFSLRMDTAYFRFGNRREGSEHAFGSAVLPVVLASLILVIIAFSYDEWIAAALLYPDSPHYVRWFGLILAFDILALLPFAHLRLQNKARIFVACKVFNVLFTILLVLYFLELRPTLGESWIPEKYFAAFRYEIDFVFLSNLIASITVFLILLLLMRRTGFRPELQLVRKMIYYSFPLIIVGICGSFNQYFAVPLQKYFLGEDVVSNISAGGVYGASQKIASIFLLFTTAFNYAAEPFFFNNSSVSDRKELYGQICRLFVLVGGLLILFIYLGIDAFQFMVDDQLRDALHVIPILLLAYLFLGVYYNVSIWYKLSDKTGYGAIISMGGVIITFAISIIFLPVTGYIASAWAALATFSFMVVAGYLLGQKLFPIAYPVGKILINILLISIVMLLSWLADRLLTDILYYFINALLFLSYISYVYFAESAAWRQLVSRNRS